MKMRLSVLALAIVAGLLSFSTASAQSTAKVYRFDRLDVDITIQSNGDMLVDETQTYTYVSGSFSGYGFRDIDKGRFDDISNVSVSEGGRAFTQSTSESPGTYYTKEDDSQFHIIWWYGKPKIPSTHTFDLKYTVVGGLRYYDGGDQLWWKAVFANHFVSIPASKITVHLPASIPTSSLMVEAYRASRIDPLAEKSIVDSRTVVVNTSSIVDGDDIEVRVQFPHGIVNGTKSSWQTAFDDQQQRDDQIARNKGIFNLIGLVLGALATVGGLVASICSGTSRGRDVPAGLAATFVSEPPDNTPPGVIGTLIDEKAEMRDILATMIDLARRGYIKIVEAESPGFMGIGKNREFTFQLVKDDPAGLRPYEQTLLAKISCIARSAACRTCAKNSTPQSR